ncbi:thiosulfate oxidation carrier protein SoxY [Roseinatronobacter alkalisoli]|uniref:Thiosulfate oxidation carrier protein SoxY n=1 Tax=Roseinatronobacter alkalisoli TaxID=3028235 RepID=A0ABT5T6L9_9RHOB|nr:thiosulfate oxidation carrier protein SoxY [Roseinatronobacter sp. HJB301]MDD7970747.1 thiosulfate oxidation carrier protein SoxY [Roseinatronobacter sp. HJB301]
MQFSRRRTLAMGLGGFAVTLIPIPVSADMQALITDFTGGADLAEGPLQITAPDIAENGSAVPVSVTCPGAKSIRILAPANPNPEVCTVHFGPLAARGMASTRIRMAETMDIIALAEMPDGSFVQAAVNVQVVVGGCTG